MKDLRKVVPNIRQAFMWSYEVWSELDAQMVKELLQDGAYITNNMEY